MLDLSIDKLFVEWSVYFKKCPSHASLEKHTKAFELPPMDDLRDDDYYHSDQNSYMIFDAYSKYDEPTCEDTTSRPKLV